MIRSLSQYLNIVNKKMKSKIQINKVKLFSKRFCKNVIDFILPHIIDIQLI